MVPYKGFEMKMTRTNKNNIPKITNEKPKLQMFNQPYQTLIFLIKPLQNNQENIKTLKISPKNPRLDDLLEKFNKETTRTLNLKS